MNLSVCLLVFTPVGQLAVGVHVESSLSPVISTRLIVTCDLDLISIAAVRETTANVPRVSPHNLNHKKTNCRLMKEKNQICKKICLFNFRSLTLLSWHNLDYKGFKIVLPPKYCHTSRNVCDTLLGSNSSRQTSCKHSIHVSVRFFLIKNELLPE